MEQQTFMLGACGGALPEAWRKYLIKRERQMAKVAAVAAILALLMYRSAITQGNDNQ